MPFLWRYELSSGIESARPPALAGLVPFNLISAARAPVRPAGEPTGLEAEPEPQTTPDSKEIGLWLLGPESPPLGLAKGTRVFAPFLGNGFFQYAKIGRELSFRARNGEELWRKPYKAYPVSDPGGDLVLLLTGDNNRIDVIDPSGNPFGVRSVSGNFMTDLDFANRRAAAALVFSTGAVTVLNEEARAILEYEHASPDQPLFLKSCALGPDARVVAIHMLAGDQDRIVVLGLEGDAGAGEAHRPEKYSVLRTIDLNATYPHLLHFAVNRHGLLLTAPNRTEYFALASGEDRVFRGAVAAPVGDAEQATNRNRESADGLASAQIYRPVFADRDYFIFGADDAAVLLNHEGVAMTRLIVGGSGAFRVLPGPNDRQFALHTEERVEMYEYAPADAE